MKVQIMALLRREIEIKNSFLEHTVDETTAVERDILLQCVHWVEFAEPVPLGDQRLGRGLRPRVQMSEREMIDAGLICDIEVLDKASYNGQAFHYSNGEYNPEQLTKADIGRPSSLPYSAELVFVDSEDTIDPAHVADLEECAQRSKEFVRQMDGAVDHALGCNMDNLRALVKLLDKLNQP